jgi:hypothetical protein
LSKRFPVSFRSLYTRYSFPMFDAGNILFFANQGDGGQDELDVAIFNDRYISEALLKSGFIQFARLTGGGYDPICFDARKSVNNREFPIVQLNHEEILCHDRIHLVANIAESFYRFVTRLDLKA